MLNQTSLLNLNIDSFSSLAHSELVIPNLIVFFILYSVTSCLIGLGLSNNRSKFMLIWSCSIVFGLLILLFFIFQPNLIIKFINLFR
jgi:hypothetical protein